VVVLCALALAACGHEPELKETPQQIAQEQGAADAHNAGTTPSPGDDETPSTDAPSTTATTEPLYDGVQALRVGDCVDLPAKSASSVRAVPCDRPHHEEVTARVDIGARFPNGAPTPEDLVRIDDCRRAFDDYVRQPTPPGIHPGGFGISPEAWYLGFHLVTCAAEADKEGNVLTGSVRKPA